MKITTPKYNWHNYKFGSISLCMIMKNEAKHLPRCLESVRGLVDEIIIVDTGSTDNSIHTARKWGCKVLRQPWQDDFSKPRNLAIQHATKQWIFIMDPDELILRQDHIRIKWLTREKGIVAFQLPTFNYGRDPHELGFRTLLSGRDPTGQFSGFVPSNKTRFFRNGYGIKFIGCWHELADWYIIKHKLPFRRRNIPIHHWTHEITQESYEAKMQFYLRMGEKKVREMPQLGQAWWELAVAECIAGYRYRAAQHITHAISLGFVGTNQLFTLARVHRMIGNSKKARLCFEKAISRLFPALTHYESQKKGYEILLR